MIKQKWYFSTILFVLLFSSSNVLAQLSYNLIGDASDEGDNCFIVTPNTYSQSGAIWYENQIDLTKNFVLLYSANFGSNDSNGADGMALVFKSTSTPEIGSLGGGVGFQGIFPALGIEFDTWKNGGKGDPNYDHIAIIKNGNNNHNIDATQPGAANGNLAGPVQASFTSGNIEDGQEHTIKIEWTASTHIMKVFFDCKLRTYYDGDIINEIFGGNEIVYFGFTGSTGGATNLHKVCFEYISFAEIAEIEDKTICNGEVVDDIDVSFPNAYSYSWSPITGVSDPSLPNPEFTPTETTLYTVSIEDECGDFYTNSFEIEVLDAPIFSEQPDITICEGDSIDLLELNDDFVTDSTVPIAYFNDLSLTSPILNPSNFSPTSDQTVFVKLGDGNCQTTTSFNIQVIELPIINTPENIIICSDSGTEFIDLETQNSDITTDVTLDIEYYLDVNLSNLIIDINNFEANSPNQIIHVKVIKNGMCFVQTSFEIILNPLPTLLNPPNLGSCINDGTFDLTVQDGLITTDTGVTITYYDASGAEITTPTAYTGADAEVITATV
uniref:L-type lectin-domain containing protein n=1 Tax=Aureivirga marina TaxID=1182451 RepID=UPI0021D1E434